MSIMARPTKYPVGTPEGAASFFGNMIKERVGTLEIVGRTILMPTPTAIERLTGVPKSHLFHYGNNVLAQNNGNMSPVEALIANATGLQPAGTFAAFYDPTMSNVDPMPSDDADEALLERRNHLLALRAHIDAELEQTS